MRNDYVNVLVFFTELVIMMTTNLASHKVTDIPGALQDVWQGLVSDGYISQNCSPHVRVGVHGQVVSVGCKRPPFSIINIIILTIF